MPPNKKIMTSDGMMVTRKGASVTRGEKYYPRPYIDKRLPGETSVEFEGKGKNLKIKKIERPTPSEKKTVPSAPVKKNKQAYA